MAATEEPVLVGRVSFIQGSLLRYVPEHNDWMEVVLDMPFGLQDTLRTAAGSRAEIILPNSTMFRMDEQTQVQLLRLDGEVTELDIATGTVRIYNKSSSSIIKAVTPFGHVVAPPQTTADLSVGDVSVEARSVRGSAYFIHAAGTTKYDLVAGSPSLIAGRGIVQTGSVRGSEQWCQWNEARDHLWEQRHIKSAVSRAYLPPQLHDEAYALEENGKWEYVRYGSRWYYLWRPVHVHADWAPFTAGRWMLWYGDHCWIPDEPFGYVTHHYGTWIYIDTYRCWYWMPPFVVVTIWPGFGHPCAWYPGRVAWLVSDTFIGWYPLLPDEPYYCVRYWGPGTIVVLHASTVDRHKHHHHRHAVCVGKDHLYSARNYRAAHVSRHIHETSGHAFRLMSVPGANHLTSALHERFRTEGKNALQRSDSRIRDRIQKNLAAIRRTKKIGAEELLERTKRLRNGILQQPRQDTRPLVRDADMTRRRPLYTIPEKLRRQDDGPPPRTLFPRMHERIKTMPRIHETRPGIVTMPRRHSPFFFQGASQSPTNTPDGLQPIFRPQGGASQHPWVFLGPRSR
ncbi:MAG: FecR family protein [Desulfobacterota bacterium]|nr:FecR family protein [Thermodesulfobacteriota bacterium]